MRNLNVFANSINQVIKEIHISLPRKILVERLKTAAGVHMPQFAVCLVSIVCISAKNRVWETRRQR